MSPCRQAGRHALQPIQFKYISFNLQCQFNQVVKQVPCVPDVLGKSLISGSDDHIAIP